MSDIHLVSSPTETNQENTRAHFICDLPKETYSSCEGVCLKDLYFQSSFVSINKQKHAHIVFLVNTLDAVIFSSLSIPESFMKISEEKQNHNTFSSTETLFDFGTVIKTKYEEVAIIEVILKPQYIDTEKNCVDLLNFILNYTRVDVFVQFYLTSNKICYKYASTTILFDPQFAEFLGFSTPDMFLFYSEVLICEKSHCVNPDHWTEKMKKILQNSYYYHRHLDPAKKTNKQKIKRQLGDYDMKPEINIPDKVVVVCDITTPQLFNDRLVRYLGIVQLAGKKQEYKNFQNHINNTSLIHYQPVHQLFLPLKSDTISSVKITLQQENHEPLHLDTAGPTLVTLRTTHNERMNCKSLVFASSRTSNNKELFPTNTPSRFFHKLPKELEYPDSAIGVKVVSMSMPARIFNITQSYNKVSIVYTNKHFLPIELAINPGHYKSITEVVKTHKNMFLAHGVDIGVKDGERIVFTNILINTVPTLKFDGHLALLLGLTADITLNTFDLILKKQHTATHNSKINLLFPDYILVYSDFVESSYVGGCMANIIKVVPSPTLSDTHTDRVHYDFQDQNLIKVCKDNISTMCIELRDISGKLIEFEDQEYTEILLAFKELT